MLLTLLLQIWSIKATIVIADESMPQTVGTITTPSRQYCQVQFPIIADQYGSYGWGSSSADWNYQTPQNWKKISLDCGGNRQSPINIITSQVLQEPYSLNIYYLSQSAQVPYEEEQKPYTKEYAGEFSVIEGVDLGNLVRYFALQLHTHLPSEHQIDGQLFDMEVHFVHAAVESGKQDCNNIQNSLAVFGILFNLDLTAADNPVFTTFFDSNPTGHQTFDLSIFLNALVDKTYYHYNGSLTTPPCTQVVNWYLFRQPITLSSGQFRQFTAFFSDTTYFGASLSDNRPIQNLNGRTVYQGTANFAATLLLPEDAGAEITTQATYAQLLIGIMIISLI